MDPTSNIFDAIMYPSAIYAADLPSHEDFNATETIALTDSCLCLKNCKHSLSPSSSTTWRIDHGEATGTKFFVIPKFAIGKPPLKIGTFIPEHEDLPEHVRKALDTRPTMIVNGQRLACLKIVQHILSALDSWSAKELDFESYFMNMPFGSRIIIETLTSDAIETLIHLAPIYDSEQLWETVEVLQDMWKLPDGTWPDMMDFNSLQLQYQIHESISLVTISSQGSELFVFKSTEREIKYMYHELRLLLTMGRHRGVMEPPLYIVTKKCRFGGKVGVCGFILKYYPLDTLGVMLLQRSKAGTLKLRDQYRWARQLTLALMHVQKSTARFYSDLKLNNVLMAPQEDGIGVVLIDFEQRGGWYSWSPPEVYRMEYLEYLASSAKLDLNVRERSRKTLLDYLPSWKPRTNGDPYRNSEHGFSSPWLALSPEEQESAQVFMLGKMLWCIFEGLGTTNGCVTVETFREEESEQSFPDFRRTPIALRECIAKCTYGAPEWQGRFSAVVRKGNRLYPRGMTGINGEPTGTARQTQDEARKWWLEEVQDAERFVNARKRQTDGVEASPEDEEVLKYMTQRPRLKDVLQTINETEMIL